MRLTLAEKFIKDGASAYRMAKLFKRPKDEPDKIYLNVKIWYDLVRYLYKNETKWDSGTGIVSEYGTGKWAVWVNNVEFIREPDL